MSFNQCVMEISSTLVMEYAGATLSQGLKGLKPKELAKLAQGVGNIVKGVRGVVTGAAAAVSGKHARD
jgi:hypothetical protein